MTNREEWLSAKIAYINGLKSPSEQQRLLVLLAEKKNRTTTDEKTLSALIRAEKTAEKAAAAKARVTAIIAAERKAAARAERKARDHELYKAAGLMIVAGMGKTRERATHQRQCVRASVHVPVPWCFLAHSLATLGHETAASTTTSIIR
ncbi:hypothetical protein ACKD5N_004018 [Shigella sonnei]